MTKQQYIKPTIKVVELQYQTHLMAGSVKSLISSGLDDTPLIKGNNTEEPGDDMFNDAW